MQAMNHEITHNTALLAIIESELQNNKNHDDL